MASTLTSKPFLRRLLRGSARPLALSPFLVILFALASLFSVPTDTEAQADDLQVTLFHDTHFHGNLEGQGGVTFAHYVGLMKKLRSELPAPGHSFFVGNGDDIAPSVMSSVFRGQHVIDVFNAAAIDVTTFGNHEFDFGPAPLRELITKAKYSYVSANVRDAKTRDAFAADLGVRQWVVKEVGGVKFGFTGLAPKETPTISSPGPDVLVLDPAEAMQEVVPKMRAAGVQIVVLLSHLGTLDTERLVAQVNGIDLALGDHEANVLAQPKVINGTIVSRRGHELQFLGQLNLSISGGKITGHTYVQHTIAAANPADAEVAALIAQYKTKLDADLTTQIGSTSVPLDVRRATVRGAESNAGNLVADALRAWGKAEVAIQNGGGLRNDKILNAGALTKRDLVEMIPFPNTAVLLRVTGEQLRAAIENGLNVEAGSGRFPQVSGMSFVYDPAAAPGSRVREILVAGKPLDLAAQYTLATNDFLAGGGDGYAMLKEAQVLIPAAGGPVVTTLLIDFVRAMGTIAPAVEGRIQVVQAPALVPVQLPATGDDVAAGLALVLLGGTLTCAAGLSLRRAVGANNKR